MAASATPVFSIRQATVEDVPTIFKLIKGIAEYEKLPHEVVATEALLKEQIFDRHGAEVLMAEEDGVTVGFALYFFNFSTFMGRTGLYLEDLFIYPEYRHKGYGIALLKRLARLAQERGCRRFEWICLDWNRPSIELYLSIGAVPLSEWTVYRLTGEKLQALAAAE